MYFFTIECRIYVYPLYNFSFLDYEGVLTCTSSQPWQFPRSIYERFEENTDFLSRLVTMVGTWVHFYDGAAADKTEVLWFQGLKYDETVMKQ